MEMRSNNFRPGRRRANVLSRLEPSNGSVGVQNASDRLELSAKGTSRELRRSIGFFGLTFVSLGSIIGSGWLLGALNAAEAAGPASLISWILAVVLLAGLALVHAELS